MSDVYLLYRVLREDASQTFSNALKLEVTTREPVYLYHVLKALRAANMGTSFAFLANRPDGVVEIVNPAERMTVRDSCVELFLQPTANPSFTALVDVERVLREQTSARPQTQSSTYMQAQSSSESRADKSGVNNIQQWVEVGGEVGRSLFNLAAVAVKSAAGEISSRIQGDIQVGVYRVQVIREIAEGGFSKVFLARDTATRDQYALKQMLCQTSESMEDAYKEMSVLKMFRDHPNIVRLLDDAQVTSRQHGGAKQVFFLFPFYSRGTVWTAIEKGTAGAIPWPYPEQEALRVFVGACNGLLALHNADISHRDIKPHNILLSDEGEAILTDLGSTCRGRREIRNRQDALLMEDEASIVCSAPYRAPELTQVPTDTVIDVRVDVWSMGCTLFAMAFGRSPFESPTEGVLRLAILNGRFTFPASSPQTGCTYSQQFCDLVTYALNTDHTQRPSVSEVMDRARALLAR